LCLEGAEKWWREGGERAICVEMYLGMVILISRARERYSKSFRGGFC